MSPINVLVVLAIAVVLLLALVQAIIVRLRRHDRLTYEKLGQPDLMSNNSPTSILAFWRWVYVSSLANAPDGLSPLLWGLRLGTALYAAGLITFIAISL
jgi:hypothetical protein